MSRPSTPMTSAAGLPCFVMSTRSRWAWATNPLRDCLASRRATVFMIVQGAFSEPDLEHVSTKVVSPILPRKGVGRWSLLPFPA